MIEFEPRHQEYFDLLDQTGLCQFIYNVTMFEDSLENHKFFNISTKWNRCFDNDDSSKETASNSNCSSEYILSQLNTS